jgi:hypothetical protein
MKQPTEMPMRQQLVDGIQHPEPATAKLLINGAGDGDRTRDIQLGKLAFYR